jgi:hypothetical protein
MYVLVNLSFSIREDTYEPLERPIRHYIPSGVIPYFCKEFHRFCRQHLDEFYPLICFPEKVVLDNRSVMCGEEVFLSDKY